MLNIIEADRRHFSNLGWLKSYWLFSFANYYDETNLNFGALRVFNDDIVEPGHGFPPHPHNEMEIITIVLSGELTHKDTMDNKMVIRAGDVQRMSAGSGLAHSEVNEAKEPVHFYQIWIQPEQADLEPSYDQKSFDPAAWKNRLCPVVSGRQLPDVVAINADATVYRAELEKGFSTTYESQEERGTFIYLKEGRLLVDGGVLNKNDQARITSHAHLTLEAVENAHFILIDIPYNSQSH